MALHVRRAVPFSPSKTLIQNPTTKRTFSKLLPPPNSAPTYLFGTLFRTFALKPIITVPISANGFGGLFHQSNCRFCEGDTAMAAPGSVQKSDEEWQIALSPGQYRVLRQKCREKEWIGFPNWCDYDEGVYECAGCGNPLYSSKAKFTSRIAWPAFYKALRGAITLNMDPDGIKTEISCSVCCGHIGHLFKGEGFKTPTDERIFTCKGSGTPTDEHHCVNSLALKFIPANLDDFSE